MENQLTPPRTCVCCHGRGRMLGSHSPCRFCRGRGTFQLHGASTAIRRKSLSAPARWLREHSLVKGYALDFGCGHGDDVFWLNRFDHKTCAFDPAHWVNSWAMKNRFDTVLCTYVLNVIPDELHGDVIDIALESLEPGGRAYFAVRRDLPRAGKQGRKVWQSYVTLPYEVMVENRNFAIYTLQQGGRS